MKFQSQVIGIPCLVEIDIQSLATEAIGLGAMEDFIPAEDDIYEIRIFDLHGKPAPWIAKYVDERIEKRLIKEYLSFFTQTY